MPSFSSCPSVAKSRLRGGMTLLHNQIEELVQAEGQVYFGSIQQRFARQFSGHDYEESRKLRVARSSRPISVRRISFVVVPAARMWASRQRRDRW